MSKRPVPSSAPSTPADAVTAPPSSAPMRTAASFLTFQHQQTKGNSSSSARNRRRAFLFLLSLLACMYHMAPPHEKQTNLSTTPSLLRKVPDDDADSVPLLDLSPSVKDVVINIGSSVDPIMPTKEMGPCAHAIAVEPIVGSQIPTHKQLSVIHGAVSDEPGVMSMRIYNRNGVSSSLAKAATKAGWNSNLGRGDGTLKIVPVITLSSLLLSIPETTRVAFLKTDMQGFDFVAVQAAGSVLKNRVTHIMTEVWANDISTYHAKNDLCRDWLPYMTELGYTVVKTTNEGDDFEAVKARCKKQLKDNPKRPSVDESAGLAEYDAYWVRNDAIGQPFPEVQTVQVFDPGFTEEEYNTCK